MATPLRFRAFLPKPYLQQITNTEELYNLSHSLAKDLVHSVSYRNKLARIGWTIEDLATEAYMEYQSTASLPVSLEIACRELRCDMMNKLVPRAKDRNLTSLDAPIVDLEGNKTTLLELLEDTDSCPEDSKEGYDDLYEALECLPTTQKQVIQLRYLHSELTIRETATALNISKSTVQRAEIDAITKLFPVLWDKRGSKRAYISRGTHGKSEQGN